VKLRPDTIPAPRHVPYLRARTMPLLALSLAAQRVLGQRPGKARRPRCQGPTQQIPLIDFETRRFM